MLRTITRSIPITSRRPVALQQKTLPSSALRSYTKSVVSETPTVKQRVVDASAPKVGKLKELAQKYGAMSVIVYLGIGCVDLGVSFAAIQFLGADKVRTIENTILSHVGDLKVRFGLGSDDDKETSTSKAGAQEDDEDEDGGKPSLAAMFLLAYGIHKTVFLPFRVAATAAITPAMVRKLHALGLTRYAPRLFGIAKKTP